MDYKKIGNFIVCQRKIKNLTQAKLAEKLFVSEKTISKWENGKGLPDTSVLPKLCEILGVSVNELLNGEKIANENYENKAEEKLLELQTTNQKNIKMLLNAEIVLLVISMLSFLSLIGVAYFLKDSMLWIRITLIVRAVIICLVGGMFCLHLEQKAGLYLCQNCGHKYIPNYWKMLFAPHVNRTRYLKCPHCHQRSWNKKVVK